MSYLSRLVESSQLVLGNAPTRENDVYDAAGTSSPDIDIVEIESAAIADTPVDVPRSGTASPAARERPETVEVVEESVTLPDPPSPETDSPSRAPTDVEQPAMPVDALPPTQVPPRRPEQVDQPATALEAPEAPTTEPAARLLQDVVAWVAAGSEQPADVPDRTNDRTVVPSAETVRVETSGGEPGQTVPQNGADWRAAAATPEVTAYVEVAAPLSQPSPLQGEANGDMSEPPATVPSTEEVVNVSIGTISLRVDVPADRRPQPEPAWQPPSAAPERPRPHRGSRLQRRFLTP